MLRWVGGIKRNKARVKDILAWHGSDDFFFLIVKLFVLSFRVIQRMTGCVSSIRGHFRKPAVHTKVPECIFCDSVRCSMLLTQVFDRIYWKNSESQCRIFKTIGFRSRLLYSHIPKYYMEMSIMFSNKMEHLHIQKNNTQQWCVENLVDFLQPNECHHSSPDLNPLEFFVL